MTKQIPESYKSGIERIEGMNATALLGWLEAELKEQTHILAGKEEDYPVQAIVSHHPYLSIGAQKRMGEALETLVLDWRNDLGSLPETAVRSLLSLVAELGVEGAKRKLLPLVSDTVAWERILSLQAAVLRALATLSRNEDRAFWNKLPNQHPEFAGMAFQVLTKIAADDALKLLSCLPDNDMAVGSVARVLPGFISEFQHKRQDAVLAHIVGAIGGLSQRSSEMLVMALKKAGFAISIPPSAQEEKKALKEYMLSFKDLVHCENRSPLEYAQ